MLEGPAVVDEVEGPATVEEVEDSAEGTVVAEIDGLFAPGPLVTCLQHFFRRTLQCLVPGIL